MLDTKLIQPIFDFLGSRTPKSWLITAKENLALLLIDHAHCEKKAASTALNLLYRYPEKSELLLKLSSIAREELLHFEKVIQILRQKNIPYQHLSPASYAQSLHKEVRKSEPYRLVDSMIIAAIIEARSCERFISLIPYLDKELQTFYQSLVKSEARHFEDYLSLAKKYSTEPIEPHIDRFKEVEQELIKNPDSTFRFHSGVLVKSAA